MGGFKDTYRTETTGGGAGSPETTKEVADGFTFTHSGLNLQAPDAEDYFQDPNYWGKLAKEIEDKAKGATVTMKHFEEAVRKVREQKDLKMNDKLVASYYR